MLWGGGSFHSKFNNLNRKRHRLYLFYANPKTDQLAAVRGFVSVESQQRLFVCSPRLSGELQPRLDFHVVRVSFSLFVLVGGGKIQIHESISLLAIHADDYRAK
jgi:hypothetical protein